MSDNPLVEAMKSKQAGMPMMDAESLLNFILTRYKLVPIDDAEEQNESEPDDSMVTTQESHAP